MIVHTPETHNLSQRVSCAYMCELFAASCWVFIFTPDNLSLSYLLNVAGLSDHRSNLKPVLLYKVQCLGKCLTKIKIRILLQSAFIKTFTYTVVSKLRNGEKISNLNKFLLVQKSETATIKDFGTVPYLKFSPVMCMLRPLLPSLNMCTHAQKRKKGLLCLLPSRVSKVSHLYIVHGSTLMKNLLKLGKTEAINTTTR